jgi:hypothetical protein
MIIVLGKELIVGSALWPCVAFRFTGPGGYPLTIAALETAELGVADPHLWVWDIVQSVCQKRTAPCKAAGLALQGVLALGLALRLCGHNCDFQCLARALAAKVWPWTWLFGFAKRIQRDVNSNYMKKCTELWH